MNCCVWWLVGRRACGPCSTAWPTLHSLQTSLQLCAFPLIESFTHTTQCALQHIKHNTYVPSPLSTCFIPALYAHRCRTPCTRVAWYLYICESSCKRSLYIGNLTQEINTVQLDTVDPMLSSYRLFTQEQYSRKHSHTYTCTCVTAQDLLCLRTHAHVLPQCVNSTTHYCEIFCHTSTLVLMYDYG